jgi:hypothetical protein
MCFTLSESTGKKSSNHVDEEFEISLWFCGWFQKGC